MLRILRGYWKRPVAVASVILYFRTMIANGPDTTPEAMARFSPEGIMTFGSRVNGQRGTDRFA
jgi:hypothetical protein